MKLTPVDYDPRLPQPQQAPEGMKLVPVPGDPRLPGFDKVMGGEVRQPTLDTGGGFAETLQAPQVAQGLMDRFGSWITGAGRKDPRLAGREFAAPAVVNPTGGLVNPIPTWKTAIGLTASTTPEQMIGIIRENIPGAEIGQDEFGNPIVRIPGRDWEYINEPGLSPRDVVNAAVQGGAYLGTAMAAAPSAATTLGRSLLTAGTGALTSLGMDATADIAGSGQGVDPTKAAMVGGLGGLFELAAPQVASLWQFLSRSGTKIPTVQEAKFILKDLGFKPEDLTDEAVTIFMERAKRAANPAEVARVAQAEGLPVPVQLNRGQRTMLPTDQMDWDMMSKGAFGEGAATVAKGFNEAQEQALRANVPAIAERIGGQNIAKGQAGPRIQKTLEGQLTAAEAGVGRAYDVARQGTGVLPAEKTPQLVSDIERAMADYMPHAPGAASEFNRLKSMVQQKTPASPILDASGKPMAPARTEFTDADIKDLFDWRRTITKLGAKPKDATEAAAFAEMKRAFDNGMDRAIIDALESGNPEAIASWQRAIQLRKEMGQKFQSGDLIAEILDKEYAGGGLRFKTSPEAVSNLIFGVKNTKMMNSPDLGRELVKLKGMVGPKSPEWQSLKEEAFIRLVTRGEYGAMQGGEFTFSGANLKRDVESMIRDNPEVWNILFDKPEQALIRQFSDVAARITNPVRGGQNFSNTAVGVSRVVKGLFDWVALGPKGKAVVSRLFPPAYDALQMGRAYQATKQTITPPQLPPGLMGGIGGTVGSR